MHTRRISAHNKRREDGSNRRSSSHDSKKIAQAMRNMKDSTHEELLIHLSIWMRTDAVVNEEYDEVEDSNYACKDIRINKESTHQKNKYKFSIVIS